MPRATLEFDLPEEQEEFDRATRALDYVVLLDNLAADIRTNTKHNETADQKTLSWDDVHKWFWEFVGESKVDLG